MSNFNTVGDWIEIHTDGTCDKADDCLISLAQAVQKQATQAVLAELRRMNSFEDSYWEVNGKRDIQKRIKDIEKANEKYGIK